jgi:2-polyprenyl-3-methyl-5-hydroxy-6-metoxy-1,4-benzoquinol methylase
MSARGGYEEGYRACKCFWGTEPGSYVKRLALELPSVAGLKVLDAGCGEGKNAAYLAEKGAVVDAVDVSDVAVQSGRALWGTCSRIEWRVADVSILSLPPNHYDIVIAYGLLHCAPDRVAWARLVSALQRTSVPGGYQVICAFNNRYQELHAHPEFRPCLLAHAEYLEAYAAWQVVAASDSDLTEQHPHNGIVHTHSMTRILVRKPTP